MKKIHSFLSVFLILVLIISSMSAIFSATAEENGISNKVYTIFLAEPSKQGDSGTDATAHSYGNSYFSTHASVYTANNAQDGWYYHSVYNYDNVESEWNRTSYFSTNINNTTNGFSWLNEESTTLKALSNFVTVSYKVRMLQTVASGEPDSDIQFYFGTANEWTSDNQYATRFDTVDIVNSNAWNEFTCTPSNWMNFYSGFFGFKAEAYPNFVGTLAIDVKDIKFTVKESDRDAINIALAANGSTYTFESLIANFPQEDNSDEENNKDHILYQANPLRAGEIGADATASVADEASRNPVHTAKDGEEAYFTYTDEYATVGQSEWNRRHYFNMGYSASNKGYEWMGDNTVLEKLKGYVTVSAKVRVTANVTSGTAPTEFPIYFGLTNQEVDNSIAQSSTVLSTVITETGVWTELTNIPASQLANFYSGYGVIRCECALFDGDLTIDVKDIVLTINDKDKSAIDSTLSSAGSSWNFDKLTAEKAEEENKGTDHILYQANPLRAGEIGSDATASIADEASRNPVHTAKDGEETYFTYTDEYATVGQSEWNRRHYFNMGYSASNKGYEWMGDNTVLEKLKGYVTVSAKVRVTANATSGTVPTEYPIYIGLTNEEAYRDIAQSSTVLSTVVTETGVWTEITNIPANQLANFYSGYGVVRVECALFNGTVTVDIKDIVLTINDKDKNAIDSTLAAAGNSWTFDKLTAEKTDEDDEKEEDKGTDHILYQANPLRAGEIGSDATASIADEESRNPVYTAKEGEEAYFTYTDEYATSGQSEWNRRHYFNMGYSASNKGYEWMGDNTVLEKLKGYVTASAKIRITANATSGTTPTEFPIYIGLTNEEAYRDIAQSSTVLSKVITETGVWTEITNIPANQLANFYSGYGVIRCECALFDGTVTVDIKDIVLTINDKDKNAIDSALSAAGSSWTFDKLTAEKRDEDLVEPDVFIEDTYIIWEANTDTVLADKNNKVNAYFEEGFGKAKYDVYKKSDEKGSYYSASFTETGKGDKNNYAAANGYLNDKTQNFGWLSNKDVLNALAPYLYVGFEYKVSSTKQLPNDAVLTLNAAEPYYPDILTFAKVNVSKSESWSTYKLTRLVDAKFLDIWYSGSLTYNLTSSSGGLDGTQTVDLKNIVLVVKESDKDEINQVLSSISGIDEVENFTKDNNENSKDYFSILSAYDKWTALSGRDYNGTNKLSINYTNNVDVAVSKTNAKAGDVVSVYVSSAMNYSVAKITVKTKSGNEIATKALKRNSEYSFVMPTSDVVVTATAVYEEERELAFLWKSFPGTLEIKPWYIGTDKRQYKMSLVDGGNQSAYKFDITDNKGCITIHGEQNISITPDRYFDTAYLYTSIKLDKSASNRTIKIGVSDELIYEVTIPKTDNYTTVKIPLKEIAKSAAINYFSIYLDNRQVGESIYVGESFVFSKEINGTVNDAWSQILDMSDYTKSATNTLLGKIGDTEGIYNPWCENMDVIGDSVLNWDLAWYYSFQNMSPYILIPKEDLMGKEYFTTFYAEERDKKIDITKYVDTGYMEFYIYCDTDGIEVPFSVEASGHDPRTFATFKVKYDKAKARPDGYMQVRIPFTYFADSGLNLDEICRVTIKGTQSSLYCDYFLLSSFRFYSNLADVPDPEPIVQPEPKPERDLPLEIDSSILDAKLDKENMILYVPEGTKIWEILAALVFDTNETYVDFSNGESIEDENTVVTEDMDMIVYRRGFLLASFDIKLVSDGNATWVNFVSNNIIWISCVAAVVLLGAGVSTIILIKKKKVNRGIK